VWSIFKQVKKALDEEDIESLLEIGAPGDEYNGEASQIESLVAQQSEFGKRKLNSEQLEQVVQSVWVSAFGPLSTDQLKQRQPAFRRVAERIQGTNYA
jgi:hypothetical protein